MSIRDEVHQLANAFSEIGKNFADGDKETAAEWMEDAFTVVKEGSDMAKVPKEERLKAVMHAMALASGQTAEASIKYSDEQAPA